MLFGRYQVIWSLEEMIDQTHVSPALQPREDNFLLHLILGYVGVPAGRRGFGEATDILLLS